MSLWPTSPHFSTAHSSHQPPPYHKHSQPLLPRHRLVHETIFTSAFQGLKEPTLKRDVALTHYSFQQLPSEEKDSACGSQAAVVADLPPNNDVGQVKPGPQRDSTGQTSIDEIRRGSLQATSTRSLGMTDHHLRLDRRSSMVPTAMTASENMSENNKATSGSKMSMAAENSAVIPEMRDRAHTVSGHSPRPLKLAISAGISETSFARHFRQIHLVARGLPTVTLNW